MMHEDYLMRQVASLGQMRAPSPGPESHTP